LGLYKQNKSPIEFYVANLTLFAGLFEQSLYVIATSCLE